MEPKEKNRISGDPAPPKRRKSIFVPLFFFVLGVVSALGYTHWYMGGRHIEMQAPSPAAESQPAVAEKKKAEPKILYYVDPMNPSNKSDKPGKAPCGMDMVPVYEEAEKGPEELPPGTVKISAEKQQLIGVQFGNAVEIPMSKSIRAVGRAVYDETRIAHVHTKFPGWVDKVHVDFVGQLVKKNQPLFSIYSPELLSTQQELLIAKKSKDYLQSSQFEGIGSHSVSLYKATRERLKLWDISDSQINDIERRGAPEKSLTLYSPLNGFVVTRNLYPGQQVSPEMDLYTIADLSNIWIQAEIYEYEINYIQLGQKATVTFPSYQGKTFTGKITYISPELDAKTRTLKVRIELPNPDFKIKPDMFANVELKVDYGNKLSIPQEAVLDSGASQTVFVAREGGYFEPRKVTLGPKVGNHFVVMDGLKEGEQVVTSANFLIDSESQIKSSPAAMAGHAGHGGQPAADHSGHSGAGVTPPPAVDHSSHGQADASGTDHSAHGGAATDHSQHSGAGASPATSADHAGHTGADHSGHGQ